MESLGPDDALQLALAGETLLLPTPEAAQELRQRFGRRQQARGLRVWPAPPILAWSQWLRARWDELTLHGLEDRVVLNRVQEDAIWAATLPMGTSQSLPGVTRRALARQARAALQRAAEFAILDRFESEADTPDAQTFVAWHRAFAARCRAEQLLPPALLPQALLEHLEAGRMTAPRSLYCLEMPASTPGQQCLMAALSEAGTAIHSAALVWPGSPAQGFAGVIPGDPALELEWAVLWMRRYFENTLASGDPARATPRIALVLPDPEAERAQLEPLLRQQLAPELETTGTDLSSQPWHFQAGPSLDSLPVLQHALSLLRWLGGEIATEAAGTLLLSPYFAHSDDFETRARFEVRHLRGGALLRPELTLDQLFRLAASASNARDATPALALARWQAVLKLFCQWPRAGAKATLADWTGRIRSLLAAAGWPGPRELAPAELRATEAWEATLDLLTTRDLLGDRVSWSQALELLAAELREVRLQDGTPEAAVQILTLAETEGRLFDAVLLLRATDAALPAPESLQPLLGRALQRRLDMPGSSAAAGFDRGLAAVRSLSHRAGSLLLVSAAQDAAGELRPSRLSGLLGFDPLPPEDFALLEQQTAPAIPLELVEDWQPVPPPPPGLVSGGARVLELQANCGFQAFASLRLAAEAPSAPGLGCDPRQAGEDLHKALQHFWAAVPGQAELAALTSADRRAAVESAVRRALQPRLARSLPQQSAAESWTGAYLQLAETRLTNLLLRWLEQELMREPFRVAVQESAQVITVGPLELSVRPDRVDEVEGGVVFVDYKTSADLHARDWSGERPRAPQLPLYALMAEPEDVRGVAFGRVRPGSDMGWISLADGDGLFPKATVAADGLAGYIALWRAELTRLATEFAAGHATPNPRAFPKSCQYCGQRLLCRLDPTEFLAGQRPESESEEDEEAAPAR